MQRTSRKIPTRWNRLAIAVVVVLSCTGMAVTSLPNRSVVLRPEIELLLDDISDEPTPDNISELIAKAQAHRGRANGWGVDGSLDKNNLAPDEVAHVTRFLRQQYPFENLTPRLAYERNAQPTRTRLSNDAIAWLNELESGQAVDPFVKASSTNFTAARAHALQKLHSEEVVAFINREGEGMARMPTYGVEFVVLPDVPTIPLASNADVMHDSPSTSNIPSQLIRYGQSRRQTRRSPFFELHASYRNDFAATRNGLIVDVDQVSGFVPHAVTERKDILRGERIGPSTNAQTATGQSTTDEPPAPLWRVANLQLVSLLKFDQPHVYLSEFMPAMTELPDLEMRDLTSFEDKALKQLYAGEDIVSKTTDHKIKMLGSLRASKDCLSCHSVDRGELLGAFSYELVRVGTPIDSQTKGALARATSTDHVNASSQMQNALASQSPGTIKDFQ